MGAHWNRMLMLWLAVFGVALNGWTDEFKWDAGGGANTNWSTPNNWTNDAGYPQSEDTAIFDGSTARTVGIGTGPQAVRRVNVSGSAAWTWKGTDALNIGTGGFHYGSSGSSEISAQLSGVGALEITAGRLGLTNVLNDFSGGITIGNGSVDIGSAGTPLGHTNNVIALGSKGRFGKIENSWSYYTNAYAVTLQGKGGIMQFDDRGYLAGLVSGAGQLIIGPAYRGYLGRGVQNNTFSGGTRVHLWDTRTYDSYKVFGTGDVRVEYDGLLQVEAAGNIDSGAKVRIDCIRGALRTADIPAIFAVNGNFCPDIDTNSSGTLGVGGSASTDWAGRAATNAPQLGNGYMTYGGFGDAGSGTFTGASLQPNLDGVYRFCCSGNSLNLDATGSTGVLTGTNAVEVFSHGIGGNVYSKDANDFTGDVTVWNFGSYIGYVLAPGAGSPLGNTNGIVTLNGGGLGLFSTLASSERAIKREVVVRGSCWAFISGNSPFVAELRVKTLTRTERGTLEVKRDPLGGRLRFIVDDGVPSVNGMVLPWIMQMNPNVMQNFVDYLPGIGFTGTVYTAGTLASAVSTSVVDLAASESVLAGGQEVYALRTAQESLTISGGAGDKLTLGSGGLILKKGTKIAAPVEFKQEGVVLLHYAAAPANSELGGVVSGTNGLTLNAYGSATGYGLSLTNDNNDFTGDITINRGRLIVATDGCLGNPANSITINGGIGSIDNQYIGAFMPINAAALTLTRQITVGLCGGVIASGGGGTLRFNGRFTGPGTLTFDTSKTIYIGNATNDYTGGTIVRKSGVSVDSGARLGHGPLTLKNSCTVSFLGPAGMDEDQPIVTVKHVASDVPTVNFYAATQTVGSIAGQGSFLLGVTKTGTLFAGGNDDSTELWGSIGQVSFQSHFVKEGTGSFTLWGENTLTGTTTVHNGSMLIHGVQSGPVVVESEFGSAPVLGGEGIIDDNVTLIGGTLMGGAADDPGVLQIAGNLAMDAASTLAVQIGSQTNVSGVEVAGNVTLGGSLKVTHLGGYTRRAGEPLVILTAAGGITGSFSAVNEGYIARIAGNQVLLDRPRGSVFFIR